MAKLVIVGPGRAGGSIAVAAQAAGHEVVGVVSRNGDTRFGPALGVNDPLPSADFIVVAVSDDAILPVCARLMPSPESTVIHLSGRTSVDALGPHRDTGGCLHPLMTLPTPDLGAASLSGAGAAVTARSGDARERISEFARSLGMVPFELDDEAKTAYHAAATAASNYVTVALGIAERLFDSADVPLDVALPLIEAAVRNVAELGATDALTGPIRRGDVGTVKMQRDAARDAGVEEEFVVMGRLAALLAGTEEDMKAVLA